jgi:hypothetical protein
MSEIAWQGRRRMTDSGKIAALSRKVDWNGTQLTAIEVLFQIPLILPRDNSILPQP